MSLNALHWQLDVSFREDAARNRKDNGPGNPLDAPESVRSAEADYAR